MILRSLTTATPARPLARFARAGLLCISLAAAGVAVTAGSASAPEPARLTADLSGPTGATAAAVFVSSAQPTKVLNWPATLTPGSAPAGTPCSNGPLAPGQTTTKRIQVYGSLRKCG